MISLITLRGLEKQRNYSIYWICDLSNYYLLCNEATIGQPSKGGVKVWTHRGIGVVFQHGIRLRSEYI